MLRQGGSGSRRSARSKERGAKDRKPRDFGARPGRKVVKLQLAKGVTVDYKDINLLQKFVSDRGKILSRRYTGVTAKEQRIVIREVKKARFLGLLPILGVKRK